MKNDQILFEELEDVSVKRERKKCDQWYRYHKIEFMYLIDIEIGSEINTAIQ